MITKFLNWNRRTQAEKLERQARAHEARSHKSFHWTTNQMRHAVRKEKRAAKLRAKITD